VDGWGCSLCVVFLYVMECMGLRLLHVQAHAQKSSESGAWQQAGGLGAGPVQRPAASFQLRAQLRALASVGDACYSQLMCAQRSAGHAHEK